MHIQFARREPGSIAFGVIYGFIALLALVAARFFPLSGFMPGCVFKALTGFPCPTCGSTRSLVHLSHGRFLAALAMNPLVVTAVIVLVFVLICSTLTRLCHGPGIKLVLSVSEADRIRVAAVLLVLLNWLYLIFIL